ncbi:uncharacterized protein MELLADRAFT_58930 [Melampsora larici-populina 98AG31]|uniref:Uncharacterized protein n=1 Tax=Melampsora larici-populina (strain 98AG31 / pathotype 3-4-7) TaxID=747676 RepID=F4R6G0_MELLP|nr:uncharacterized protein MELLADRAFT_58930 [Melampsora larici-populina 98AG31]EGG11872.1 hypothetical protein MELLADRAFT_58930 [Melampsora larici-populina 98AG31]
MYTKKGFISYIGDVNNETGSQTVLGAMLRESSVTFLHHQLSLFDQLRSLGVFLYIDEAIDNNSQLEMSLPGYHRMLSQDRHPTQKVTVLLCWRGQPSNPQGQEDQPTTLATQAEHSNPTNANENVTNNSPKSQSVIVKYSQPCNPQNHFYALIWMSVTWFQTPLLILTPKLQGLTQKAPTKAAHFNVVPDARLSTIAQQNIRQLLGLITGKSALEEQAP